MSRDSTTFPADDPSPLILFDWLRCCWSSSIPGRTDLSVGSPWITLHCTPDAASRHPRGLTRPLLLWWFPPTTADQGLHPSWNPRGRLSRLTLPTETAHRYTLVADMKKRLFDEIDVGESHETPGITITDWHVMNFAAVSMDFFELHTNEEYARRTQFGRRVAHGLLGLADRRWPQTPLELSGGGDRLAALVLGFHGAHPHRRHDSGSDASFGQAGFPLEGGPRRRDGPI